MRVGWPGEPERGGPDPRRPGSRDPPHNLLRGSLAVSPIRCQGEVGPCEKPGYADRRARSEERGARRADGAAARGGNEDEVGTARWGGRGRWSRERGRSLGRERETAGGAPNRGGPPAVVRRQARRAGETAGAGATDGPRRADGAAGWERGRRMGRPHRTARPTEVRRRSDGEAPRESLKTQPTAYTITAWAAKSGIITEFAAHSLRGIRLGCKLVNNYRECSPRPARNPTGLRSRQ